MARQLNWITVISSAVAGALITSLVFTYTGSNTTTRSVTTPSNLSATAAEKVYVKPGEKDEYYMFASGGHSGNIRVLGVPSMRTLRTIPVFTPESASGYGFDQESKEMLGGFTWGDLHHPALSETKGDYDGRWLYATDNANNRAAVIDLKTFKTIQVTDPIPNLYGPHCAAFVTPNSEYFFLPSRFSGPVPSNTYVPLKEYSEKYFGTLAAMAIDQQTGKISLDWELLLPPWQYDISDAGKLESDGWAILSTYNSEESTEGKLETGASQNDKDYLVVINWKEIAKRVKEGKYDEIGGAKVVDPTKEKGLVYLIPAAKSPHGATVTPDGRFFEASGKLAPTVALYDFRKIEKEIEKGNFVDEVKGLPVLDYDAVLDKEVTVGIGPLHTDYDDQGYAYTTLFIDSAVTKWNLSTGEVVEKIPVQYNPGHLTLAEGDTVKPDGKYMVSLNKQSKDRFLPVGPSYPENLQLFGLGDKTELLSDTPADPEPHYAQIVKADKIQPIKIYNKEDYSRPDSVWKPEDARIEQKEDGKHIYMIAGRSSFTPDKIEVEQGEKLTFHVTNVDLDEDITHGFGISEYDVNLEVNPGETKVVEITADKQGVYTFYCTNFCSALHQEMAGYLLVKPKS